LIVVGGIAIKSRLFTNATTAQKQESGGPKNAKQSTSPDAKVNNGDFLAGAPMKDRGTSPDGGSKQASVLVRRERRVPRAVDTIAKKTDRIATKDEALDPAPVLEKNAPAHFAVQLNARPLKLTVVNGHGDRRTISLPPVSFGSQRLLTRSASYAPVSDTRGAW
jgi:hypothetical protein